MDSDKLEEYVRRFNARHEGAEWPTVRQCARGMKVAQRSVEDTVESSLGMSLASYFTLRPEPLGDHYVEIVEAPP